MTNDANHRDTGSPLSDEEIIERFGGIRPMAAKLGVAVTTVQGWKNRGHIPENRRHEIRAAAARHGVDLGPGAPPAGRPEPDVSRPAEAKSPESLEPPETPREAPGEPASAAEVPRPERKTPGRTTEAAQDRPAPAAATPSRIGRAAGPGLAWAALALAILVAAALLSRPLWEPALYPGAGSSDGGGNAQALRELDARSQGQYDELRQRLTALEAGGGEAGEAFARQLGALEDSLSGLESTMSSLDDGVTGLDRRIAALEAARGEVPEEVRASLRDMTAELDSLGERLGSQEKTLADGLAALRERVAELDKRVGELESRPVQTGEKIAALALAVGQVEAALDSGRPYREALDRLAAIAEEDSVVSNGLYRLSQWADAGIPPHPALQRRFAEIAPAIDRALADGGGDSWLERTWHSISTVVTVRRVDGEGEVSPVSKAEAALADGDLATAVAALDAAGPVGEAGSAWLEDARARVFAEAELQSLYGRVIAPLAAGEAAGAEGSGR